MNPSSRSDETVEYSNGGILYNSIKITKTFGGYLMSFFRKIISHHAFVEPSKSEEMARDNLAAKAEPTRAQTQRSPRMSSIYLDEEDYGIILQGRSCDENDEILTQPLTAKIHTALPPRWRLCTTWSLLYSTAEHGFSLATLFSRSRRHEGPQLVAVKDFGGAMFGLFTPEPIKPHLGHYGTGECFLWRIEDGNNDTKRVHKYGSAGGNDYFLVSEIKYLAAGCSEGKFGLWIDEQLLKGHSQKVSTYENDVLASEEHFEVDNLELWGLYK